jgi:hypothetical protein
MHQTGGEAASAYQVASTKADWGQFLTTNPKIVEGFVIPESLRKMVIEPFAGEGHLILHFALEPDDVECYDIETRMSFVRERNTLLEPPYTNRGTALTITCWRQYLFTMNQH